MTRHPVPAVGFRRFPDFASWRVSVPETINITEEHRRAFEALTSGKFDNFCLFSCTANGHPAAAIAVVTVQPSSDRTGEVEYLIAPLFVSVGPGIALLDHDGREA